MKQIDIVIYHKNCNDGHASAVVAHYWLTKKQPDVVVDYIPMQYGTPPPDVNGKGVLVLDFSFNLETTNIMIQNSTYFKCIDHHLTSKNVLENISEEYKIFDMYACGATLTWKFFTDKETPMPLFLQYIQDRDIWTRKLPCTDEVFELYDIIPKTSFEKFEQYILSDDLTTDELVIPSYNIKFYKDSKVENILSKNSIMVVNINNNLKIVAYYNTPTYINDVGHALLEKYPFIDFTVNYQHDLTNDVTFFSLRSRDDRDDVEAIAKLFGGGGHRNAAGIKIDGLHCKLPPPSKHIDSHLVYEISKASREIVIYDEYHYSAVKVEMSAKTINFSKDMITLLKTKFNDIEGVMYYNGNKTQWFLNFETYSLDTKKL